MEQYTKTDNRIHLNYRKAVPVAVAFTVSALAVIISVIAGPNYFSVLLILLSAFANVFTLRSYLKETDNVQLLESESRSDELTGLGNRRAFEQELRLIESNPGAYDDAVLVMLDLNGLKVVNDTYGHSVGDELIATAAMCITETIGSGCKCFRIGGDEFTVILHDYTGSVSLRLAEMRRWIAEYNRNHTYKLSIAHGESTLRYLSGGYRTISDWKQDADINMYNDKRRSYIRPAVDSTAEYQEIIRNIITTVENRDEYNRAHSLRVRRIALLAGESLKLSADHLHQIETAAMLHDIGKISIPDHILLKPGGLTESEYEIVRQYPARSAEIVSGSGRLQKISDIILHHHERYDGTGYPDGLKGEEIPLGARIIFIADSIDAMTARRSYRDAYHIDRCRQEIEKNLGTMYDPKIGRIILDRWDEVTDILLTCPNALE